MRLFGKLDQAASRFTRAGYVTPPFDLAVESPLPAEGKAWLEPLATTRLRSPFQPEATIQAALYDDLKRGRTQFRIFERPPIKIDLMDGQIVGCISDHIAYMRIDDRIVPLCGGGGGPSPATNVPEPVADTGTVGDDLFYARGKHGHQGVHKITKDTAAMGDLVFAGSGVTQDGKLFTFGGGAGGEPHPATEVPEPVAPAGAVGTSLKYARENHEHEGVHSITKDTAADGDITFAGTGVSQSGTTFTFTSGAASRYLDQLFDGSDRHPPDEWAGGGYDFQLLGTFPNIAVNWDWDDEADMATATISLLPVLPPTPIDGAFIFYVEAAEEFVEIGPPLGLDDGRYIMCCDISEGGTVYDHEWVRGEVVPADGEADDVLRWGAGPEWQAWP